MRKYYLLIMSLLVLLSSCTSLKESYYKIRYSHPPIKHVQTTPKIQNFRQLAAFHDIKVSGPVDLEILVGRPQYTLRLQNLTEASENIKIYVKRDVLHIDASAISPISPHRLRAVITTRELYELNYRGNGSIKITGLSETPFRAQINTDKDVTIAGRNIDLQRLKLDGSGPVTITGVRARHLELNAKGSNVLKINGEVHLEALRVSGNRELLLYWIDTPELHVILRGNAKVELGGQVNILDAQTFGNSYLDARYLRSKDAYVKAYDFSEVHTRATHRFYTLARGSSNIYCYKHSKYPAKHMVGNGAVLVPWEGTHDISDQHF